MSQYSYFSFVRERGQLVPNIILSLGISLSAFALSGGEFSVPKLVISFVALFAFILELRFMDEIKDFEKDKVAHPDRPLPRGSMTVKGIKRLILSNGILLCGIAVLVSLYSLLSGAAFAITIIWLILMYKEFFFGEKLQQFPLVYAITHQVVIFPVIVFAVSLFGEALGLTTSMLAYGSIMFGGFFSFEVGRKLDPEAPAILKTYLGEYGKGKTSVLIAVLLLFPLGGALLLDMFLWVLIPTIIILLVLPLILKAPQKYESVEGVIALNLIYNSWFLFIAYLIGVL